jgi:hypothetical protein
MCTPLRLQLQQLCQEFSQQPHPNLQYPSYYTVPFHSYDDGNLNWQVRPATKNRRRALHKEPLLPWQCVSQLQLICCCIPSKRPDHAMAASQHYLSLLHRVSHAVHTGCV